jgi:hypothetical protein
MAGITGLDAKGNKEKTWLSKGSGGKRWFGVMLDYKATTREQHQPPPLITEQCGLSGTTSCTLRTVII